MFTRKFRIVYWRSQHVIWPFCQNVSVIHCHKPSPLFRRTRKSHVDWPIRCATTDKVLMDYLVCVWIYRRRGVIPRVLSCSTALYADHSLTADSGSTARQAARATLIHAWHLAGVPRNLRFLFPSTFILQNLKLSNLHEIRHASFF